MWKLILKYNHVQKKRNKKLLNLSKICLGRPFMQWEPSETSPTAVNQPGFCSVTGYWTSTLAGNRRINSQTVQLTDKHMQPLMREQRDGDGGVPRISSLGEVVWIEPRSEVMVEDYEIASALILLCTVLLQVLVSLWLCFPSRVLTVTVLTPTIFSEVW